LICSWSDASSGEYDKDSGMVKLPTVRRQITRPEMGGNEI
jgi:hypothetical protein